MKKHIQIFAAIAWSGLLVVVGSGQVPQSVLIGQIEESGNVVYSLSHDFSDKEKTNLNELTGNQYQTLFEKANECVANIDKAVAAGAPDSKTVSIRLMTLNYVGNTPPTAQMSLSQLKFLCQRMISMTGGKMAKSEAEDAAQYVGIWLKLVQDGKLSQIQAPIAAENGKQALAKLDRARAAGLSDNEQIEVVGGRTISVSDAREQIVYLQGEAEKVANSNKAAEEAQYEPFRQVLSGDKLALYNGRLKIYSLYGAAGLRLKTPQDYAISPIWCESGVNRNGIMPMWEVSCWSFRGMAKIGGPVTRTGQGETAPSSAYR
jgi:hypothetical protein